jgi:hypothetical protein
MAVPGFQELLHDLPSFAGMSAAPELESGEIILYPCLHADRPKCHVISDDLQHAA